MQPKIMINQLMTKYSWKDIIRLQTEIGRYVIKAQKMDGERKT